MRLIKARNERHMTSIERFSYFFSASIIQQHSVRFPADSCTQHKTLIFHNVQPPKVINMKPHWSRQSDESHNKQKEFSRASRCSFVDLRLVDAFFAANRNASSARALAESETMSASSRKRANDREKPSGSDGEGRCHAQSSGPPRV